jgi:hypothetical protein
MRALFNKDIATGTINVTDDYATKGPSSTWDHLNDVLPPPEPVCYTWLSMSCTKEQKEWLRDGTAIVKDFIVVGRDESRTSDEPDSEHTTNYGHSQQYSGQRGSQERLANEEL